VERVLRPLLGGLVAAVALAACGLLPQFGDLEETDCSLEPVGGGGPGLHIGPARASATLCASTVRVNGRDYSVGVGRWLDEDALVLAQYGPITHANSGVAEPIAYAIDGVDPEQILVMKAGSDERDDLGPTGPFMVLWGDLGTVPAAICGYADPLDPQYPGAECPLQEGRTYGVEMIVACGLDVPMGPYGGHYWLVVDPPPDPPAGSPYPGMYSGGLEYGTIQLLADGRLRYISELGGELTLVRTDDAQAADSTCPRSTVY
jgi:hypothetical protein